MIIICYDVIVINDLESYYINVSLVGLLKYRTILKSPPEYGASPSLTFW